MSNAHHMPLLQRLLRGDLSSKAIAGLLWAMDDPGTVEWREEGDTLRVDIYKDPPRAELIDLLDGPDAHPEVLDLKALRQGLLSAR